MPSNESPKALGEKILAKSVALVISKSSPPGTYSKIVFSFLPSPREKWKDIETVY